MPKVYILEDGTTVPEDYDFDYHNELEHKAKKSYRYSWIPFWLIICALLLMFLVGILINKEGEKFNILNNLICINILVYTVMLNIFISVITLCIGVMTKSKIQKSGMNIKSEPQTTKCIAFSAFGIAFWVFGTLFLGLTYLWVA
ncbi:MAG: hypothetical protein LBL93_06240 [Ruminococcus sp.]|jgi:uncharacterized membrane protein|nr:hypothetical protein [Ruminococcus sp.]